MLRVLFVEELAAAAAAIPATAAAAADKDNDDNKPAASIITESKHIFVPFSAHNCEITTLCGE